MAFIPVPDTWEIRVEAALTSAPNQVNVWYMTVTHGTALTQATADGYAEAIENLYESSFLNTYLSTFWSLQHIQMTDLTTATAPQFSGTFDALSGTDATQILPPQVSLVTEHLTALRGRSYRGRTYMGGFCEDGSNTGPVPGLITAAGAFFIGLSTLLAGNGGAMAVVSRYSGTALVPGPGGQTLRKPVPRVTGVATPVTAHSVTTQWKTQRRRAVVT